MKEGTEREKVRMHIFGEDRVSGKGNFFVVVVVVVVVVAKEIRGGNLYAALF